MCSVSNKSNVATTLATLPLGAHLTLAADRMIRGATLLGDFPLRRYDLPPGVYAVVAMRDTSWGRVVTLRELTRCGRDWEVPVRDVQETVS